MKHIYTLLFLIAAYCGNSQVFTNGSVYNYSVGDTIVTSSTDFTQGWNNSGITTYRYRIFTSKQMSANLDTAYYKVHEVLYTPKQCSNCVTSISASNASFAVTNLTASVLNFTLSADTCFPQIDTTSLDPCNRYVHARYVDYYSNPNCIAGEPGIDYFIFMEGIGEFREKRFGNSFPKGMGYKTALISAHKAGSNCGVAGAIPNGINEWSSQNEKLKVYPNPSAGNYFMETPTEGDLIVLNMYGEEIFTKPVVAGKNSFDLSHSEAGVYILKYTCRTGSVTAKVVKQ